MIIWTGKPWVCDGLESLGTRIFRSTIEVGFCSVMWMEEIEFSGVFAPAVRYAGVEFTRHFMLGYSEEQYDGFHCAFSIGWLHFTWWKMS